MREHVVFALLFVVTSAAICWGLYELFDHVLAWVPK